MQNWRVILISPLTDSWWHLIKNFRLIIGHKLNDDEATSKHWSEQRILQLSNHLISSSFCSHVFLDALIWGRNFTVKPDMFIHVFRDTKRPNNQNDNQSWPSTHVNVRCREECMCSAYQELQGAGSQEAMIFR